MTQQTNHKFSPEVRKRAVRMVFDHQTGTACSGPYDHVDREQDHGSICGTSMGRETQMLNLFGPLTIARSRRPIVHASAGHLPVGQYAARSFPERWPAVPLLACH